MRMIEQTTTKLEKSIKINDPIYVYDTTGLYTDQNYRIDIKKGLHPTRKEWINNRFDTQICKRDLPDNLKSNVKKSSLKSKTSKPITQTPFNFINKASNEIHSTLNNTKLTKYLGFRNFRQIEDYL